MLAAVGAVAALAFFSLRILLAEVHVSDIRRAAASVSWAAIATAVVLTSASYLCLTLYDVLALRTIGRPLPYRTAALASFTSYTLSHNLGLSVLTGGSARYRIYTAAGLGPADVARIVTVAAATFWGGVMATSGTALLFVRAPIAVGTVAASVAVAHAVGIATLVATIGALIAARFVRQVSLFGWRLPLPTPRQAIAQIAVAGLDLALACTALFVLIPNAPWSLWPAVFIAYVLAIIIALLTHVPGGIGVFESVVIAVAPQVPLPALVAALLLYRLIYYLLPLIVAAVLMAAIEGRRWRAPIERSLGTAQAVAGAISPTLLAALTFIGGGVLLISGALPAIPTRLALLRDIVPLPFVEASQIAASLVGTALLMLSHGLYRRLDSAFQATRVLLIAGIVFSIAKGFDFEEAAVLSVVAATLHWTRASFYRRGPQLLRAIDWRWAAGAVLMLGLSIWIGLFVHAHVEYRDELWWRFAWRADSARFLRASFAASVGLAALLLYRLTSSVRREPESDQAFDPLPALRHARRTDAFLALTGDKRFVGQDDAFVMYQVEGRSFIMMGDPVGRAGAGADLVWQVRERADRAAGRIAMYQITADAVPIAIDLGLAIVKYGEEARVDLSRFTLEGKAAKTLRHAIKRAEAAGATFTIVAASGVAAIIDELRLVSDAWLVAKRQHEKRFSVGAFDPEYLTRTPVAVVHVAGRIVAFANVLATDDRNELSVDLMRHADDVPYGTMDYLFCQLMLWGQREGYVWFSLGVAPLSGLARGRLAPLWARLGDFVYRHGEGVYRFEGLRAFKEKFSPTWEPRYIAAPSGAGFARALLDLKRLVSG